MFRSPGEERRGPGLGRRGGVHLAERPQARGQSTSSPRSSNLWELTPGSAGGPGAGSRGWTHPPPAPEQLQKHRRMARKCFLRVEHNYSCAVTREQKMGNGERASDWLAGAERRPWWWDDRPVSAPRSPRATQPRCTRWSPQSLSGFSADIPEKLGRTCWK